MPLTGLTSANINNITTAIWFNAECLPALRTPWSAVLSIPDKPRPFVP
jgi:hypothetical protein